MAFLKQKYPPVPFSIIRKYMQGDNISLPEQCSVITFDDSLKEQAEVISPYLADQNISGVFNLSTCIFENEPLTPQVVHFGTAYYGVRKFFSLLSMYLGEVGIEKNDYQRMGENYIDIYDLHRKIKRFLKYDLSGRDERVLLMHIWNNHLVKDVPDIMQKVYMSKQDVRNLINMGHEIGCHTHTHPLINDQTFNKQIMEEEIKKPKRILEEITEKVVDIFAYPYAKKEDILFNKENINSVRSLGFDILFTIYDTGSKKIDKNYVGRYSSQSTDSIDDLEKNSWGYEIV